MITFIGEMVLDTIQGETTSFYAGGAPYNVAKRYGHLGNKCFFCSIIGHDEEGVKLFDDIYKHKNIFAFLSQNEKVHSSVTYVTLDENHDRHFTFELHRTYELFPKIPRILYKTSDTFHFSSLALTNKRSAKKMLHLMKKLHKLHKRISFDVNLRPSLFKSNDDMIKIYKKILPHIDILKVSEDEATLLNLNEAALNQDVLLLLSKGDKGGDIIYHHKKISLPSYPCLCLSTLGAGDAFLAGALFYLESIHYENIEKELENILKYANASGAYAISHDQDQYPSKDELDEFIKQFEDN